MRVGGVNSPYRVEERETELEAWKVTIEIHDRLRAKKRNVDLDFGSNNYCLCVFQMKSTVMNNRSFVRMNPSLTACKQLSCAYVGMTSTSREDRYSQHINPDHKTSTKWGRDYFVRPYEKALRQNWLSEFQGTSRKVDEMNKYEALLSF